MSFATGLVEQFTYGLLTPLTALCVLPLYPAFITYLAHAGEGATGHRLEATLLGLAVMGGVIAFMAGVGIVFAFVLQSTPSHVVERVSPVAFAALFAMGVILLADWPVFGRLGGLEPPHTTYPLATAFGYGLFFGAIVIPCNPGLIALAFARSPLLFDTHLQSVLGFLVFGIGIGVPLFALAIASDSLGQRLVAGLTRHKGPINQATGAVLVVISLYYLLFIFEVIPLPVDVTPPNLTPEEWLPVDVR